MFAISRDKGGELKNMLIIALIILVVLPLIVIARAWQQSGVLAERHHAHHDTYGISTTLLLCIAICVIFMSSIGICITSLCATNVFHSDAVCVGWFFVAFVVTVFVLWRVLSRYCVATYEEEMYITPLIGSTFVIPYKDISHMEWTSLIPGTSHQSLRISSTSSYLFADFVAMSAQQAQSSHAQEHKQPCARPFSGIIWGIIDTEQILMRINRFDVLSATKHTLS